MRRFTTFVAVAVAVALVPAAGHARPRTTLDRTIQDLNEDNLLEYAPGEPHIPVPESFMLPKRARSIINFLQLSDFQMVDEESPARVEFLDSSQRNSSFRPFSAAYRPMESLTTQVTEAMVRAVRGIRSPVTGRPLKLAILTGDNADNQQYNETRWFIDILDGAGVVDPNSGVESDDCRASDKSLYDGVRGGGSRYGYYEPDSSDGEDGAGYSPDREANRAAVGADVTVRDFPGLLEAANRPFSTVGLDVPWYSAFGNHDALIQGNSGDAYVGPYGPTDREVSDPRIQTIAVGCRKPIAPDESGNPEAATVPGDPKRCFLAKDEAGEGAPGPCAEAGWIEQHFETTGKPKGHGFVLTEDLPGAAQKNGYGRPAVADANNDGYYSFSPVRGLRFVVLDTITDECGTLFCSEGSVDDPQFRWLTDQIDKAASIGQYVIVFSHHTLKTTRFPTTDPSEQPVHYGQRVDRDRQTNPQLPSVMTLEELYCAKSNVLAHVSGHEHENYVRHHLCEKDSPPTIGSNDFWFVSSAAHIDWPQQARMIELIDNRDGTMSMVLTVLDHGGVPNPGTSPVAAVGDQVLRLAGIARELAFNDYQNDRGSRGDPEERNLLIHLDRAWPFEAQAK